ncbi:MAG: alpha/beta hydrolase, partial [Methylosarcina sp.]
MKCRKIICGTSILLAGLLFLSEAFPQIINSANYRYPYKNPFIATSTVALLKGNETVPSVTIRDLRITVYEGRNDIYLLEGKGQLRYRFYQQRGPAPLIFIIPGISSSAYAGSVRYIAEFLAGHGFHVLALPSPYNWNFTLAASRWGLPGLIHEDVRNLYTVMQLTLNTVKEDWQAEIGKIGLLGLSEGARASAYIGKLDAEQKRIGIATCLLINPPVDMLRAVRQIDFMASRKGGYGPRQLEHLENYAVGLLAEALRGDPNDPNYFLNWDQRSKLEDWQYQYLIGTVLQRSVGEAMYVSDLAFNWDYLKTPISWGHRSDRFEEIHSYSMMEYLKNFLVPRVRQIRNKDIDIEKLNAESSLKSIQGTLKNNKNIFLMHNRDDFLISEEDVIFLNKIFDDRAKIYPRGGHLGNLWYPMNKQNILDIFSPLLQGT